MPTDAGQTNNGINEPEDLIDFLQWNDLTKMPSLHVAGNQPSDCVLHKGRRFSQFLKLFQIIAEFLRMSEEVAYEAAARIAEQVFGIVLGLEIPLLSLSVFDAEFTH
jgi:hypothetical protein